MMPVIRVVAAERDWDSDLLLTLMVVDGGPWDGLLFAGRWRLTGPEGVWTADLLHAMGFLRGLSGADDTKAIAGLFGDAVDLYPMLRAARLTGDLRQVSA